MPELFAVDTPPVAWRKFTQALQPHVTVEHVAVVQALDRVLAADLTAPHDLPSFARSTVDGYAVAAADTYGASASLPAYLTVVGEVPMGRVAAVDLDVGEAALVHTGSMIPTDADAVVMVEQTQITGGWTGDQGPTGAARREQGPGFRGRGPTGREETEAGDQQSEVGDSNRHLPPSTFEPFGLEVFKPVAVGENVIQVGEDVRAGAAVLPAGHRMRPQDIGGLLALGFTEVAVARPPRVAILSQGDEVVPPQQEPLPGQVRDINSYTLAALARRAGGIPLTHAIVPDDLQALQAAAAHALADADVLVMSAGSSVSFRDLTAEVIAGLGAPGVLVHGVSVRPGKPTILAACDGKPVFGLPGNPVSAMVIFDLFVTPTIRLLLGAAAAPTKTQVRARLARNVASTTGREDYVQVRLETRPATGGGAPELWAVPVFGKSNLIYTLIRSDGAVQIPLDSNGIAEGEWVTVTLH